MKLYVLAYAYARVSFPSTSASLVSFLLLHHLTLRQVQRQSYGVNIISFFMSVEVLVVV